MVQNLGGTPIKSDFFGGKYARWIILGIFLATTLIFFSDILFGKKFLWDDVIEYTYPLATFAARSTASGQIPHWNPYTFSGMPFAADFQAQYFYPPHFLLPLFLKADGSLPVKAIEWVILLHFALAQWAMFRFCRSRGISGWGSLIAAVSYAFCGSLAVKTIHPMVAYQLAYFPLILTYFHEAVFMRRWRSVLYTGLFLGLAIISGHPQTSLYILIFLAGYALWTSATALFSKELGVKDLGFAAIRAAVPVVIAIGLVAIQFFPAKELASLSERNEITYEKSADGSMQSKQWLTAVVPNLFGAVFPSNPKMQFALPATDDTPEKPHYEQTHFYWDTAFYFGIVALMFGLYGAARRWNTPLGGYLLAISGFALLYGLGKNGFLHEMLYGVPVFGSFRNPGRMMFYVGFAFSYFAGIGFDSLLLNRKNPRELKIFLLVVTVPLLLAVLAAAGTLADMTGVPEIISAGSVGATALILAMLAIGAGLLMHRGILSPAAAGILLAATAFIDLTLAYAPFSKGAQNPADMYRIDPALKEHFQAKDINNLFRVSIRNNYGMAMPRNQGPLDQIMLFEGYNPILLQRRSPPAATPEEVMDLLNIRYILQFDPATGQNGFAERPSCLPRARLTYQTVVTSPENVENRMKQGGIDYRQIAVLEEQPEIDLPNVKPEEIPHSINCVRYTNNVMEYSVTTDKPGILCLSEIWYPSWKAEIDGKPAKMLRANYSLRAIAVPAGTHSVVLRYDSALFTAGIWTTTFTLVAVFAGLFFDSRRKRTDVSR
ncbi:hypothetical protein MASR2M18_15100 [Ignavibacteria bacterium]|nr:YfhO family protein [Bacteroidota bacterium]MCZ2132472.1 hypothetical protein [Bacteroidota bacterium]